MSFFLFTRDAQCVLHFSDYYFEFIHAHYFDNKIIAT